MRCLAVNTATTTLSLALADGSEILGYFETAETRDQGNTLLSRMGESLEKAGLSYADVDLLAVVTGPGSFTGIRIGIAAVRGIALAAKIPMTGISSFDLFAEEKEGMRNIVAVESWREELYFRLEGEEPVNLAPEDFVKRAGRGNFFISGDAREKLRPFFPNAAYAERTPNAADLARISMKRGPDAQKPSPFYLREADVTIKKA